MNVCRFGYKRSDGKCALNGKPKTVKDVLLERWRGDTKSFAEYLTALGVDGDTYYYNKKNPLAGNPNYEWYVGTTDRDEAIAGWIAYLNSPAEVTK
jgi:hypothetical protein